MGKYSIFVCGLAAFLLYGLNHKYLMILAIFAMLGSFWSLGIMHNHAVVAARDRHNYTGGFNDFTPEEVDQVPNWITSINIVVNVIGFILLITSFIMILT